MIAERKMRNAARLRPGYGGQVRTKWRMALLVLVCGVAAFRTGSRVAPHLWDEVPQPGAKMAGALPPMQFATGLGVRIYDGTNTMLVDPCKGQAKIYASISQTANSQVAAGTASKKIHVCSINVVVAAATNVALVEGTGTTCATGTAGVPGFGGATAATGWNFGAGGGIAVGNGDSSLGSQGTAGDNLCLFNSGTGQVSGGLSYVVQ